MGSPLQQLSKFLSTQLQYAEKVEYYIKNASHFIERLRNVDVRPEHLLVSFDDVSLFTNIPVDELLDIIQQVYEIPKGIINLPERCLNNTFFMYKN